MTHAHTPGPWVVDPADPYVISGDHASSRIRAGTVVATMPREIERHHAAYATLGANARLIAAAPALLAACGLMVKAYGKGFPDADVERIAEASTYAWNVLAETLGADAAHAYVDKAARAALEAAKGGTDA